MQFGEKLKKLRTEKGMTQEEVAKAIGITRRAYASYEKNNVRPRKRQTYEKLASVLNCDMNYLLVEDSMSHSPILTSGLGLISMGAAMINPLAGIIALGTMAAESAIKNQVEKTSNEVRTCNNDMLWQYEKKQRQFRVTALGIIITTLANKGTKCQMGNKQLLPDRVYPDEYITISDQDINSWWFKFWSKDKELDEHVIIHIADRADILFSSFATTPADPRRKSSIVVDDDELYKELLKLKEHNSYRGNMSVILVDVNNAQIDKESLLSTYEMGESTDKLSIL